jgi:hypothetical protein
MRVARAVRALGRLLLRLPLWRGLRTSSAAFVDATPNRRAPTDCAAIHPLIEPSAMPRACRRYPFGKHQASHLRGRRTQDEPNAEITTPTVTVASGERAPGSLNP